MPKIEKTKMTKIRHNPFDEQIERKKKSVVKNGGDEEEEREKCVDDSGDSEEDFEDGRIVSKKLTKKILHVAMEQKKLDEIDEMPNFDSIDVNISEKIVKDFEDDKNDYFEGKVKEIDEINVDSEGYVFSDLNFDDVEKSFGCFFLNKNEKEDNYSCDKTKNLAEIILEKLKQKNEFKKYQQNEQFLEKKKQEELEMIEETRLHKIEEVYKKVGDYLSVYKHGKIPKAFKILPKLNNWEQLLYQTNPIKWTPNAMFQATKIFASNLNQKLAQRFFNLVLLPAVRENIAEYKKLNYHYYQALIYALFKSAAWFKGILIPLLQQECTLRECVIFGSILSKASIPVLHSSACIIKLCSIKPWSSQLSYIITTLINKKYALPYKVLNELLNYFCGFALENREMPVVWHQTILVFVQRYKYELSEIDRHRLSEVLRSHFHHKITPEIRREMQIGYILNANKNADIKSHNDYFDNTLNRDNNVTMD